MSSDVTPSTCHLPTDDSSLRSVKANPIVRNVLSALCCLAIVAAAVMAAYPFAADAYGSWLARRDFTRMTDTYQTGVLDRQRAAAIDTAEAYNVRLASGQVPNGNEASYDRQLRVDGSDVLCWLEVPKLSLTIPVYRGATDEVLMVGAGHVESSSLPVGGDASNCVITAHSGMRDKRMFDEIDRLELGDQVVLWTLGVPYAYRIADMDVIDPDDVQEHMALEERDVLTLVTCRPIGINSERLVVSALRTPYDEAFMAPDPIASFANARTFSFFGALLLLVVLGMLLLRWALGWKGVVPVVLARRRKNGDGTCAGEDEGV